MQTRPTSFAVRMALPTIALGLICSSLAFGVQPLSQSESQAADAFFVEKIQPILEARCYECHSHQAKKAKGGLVLDSKHGWTTGGESGEAIVPGDADASLLVTAVRYESLEMPPDGRLPQHEIELLERWIAKGAADPRESKPTLQEENIDWETAREHWAFQPLQKSVAPNVSKTDWPRNFVDRYVLHQLKQNKLTHLRMPTRTHGFVESAST